MHAVARLVLHPLIPNIQASLGEDGAGRAPQACLDAGANDLGGTLMNESISRAAGTEHGQELPPDAMEALIRLDRPRAAAARHALRQVAEDAPRGILVAAELAPIVLTPPRRKVAAG